MAAVEHLAQRGTSCRGVSCAPTAAGQHDALKSEAHFRSSTADRAPKTVSDEPSWWLRGGSRRQSRKIRSLRAGRTRGSHPPEAHTAAVTHNQVATPSPPPHHRHTPPLTTTQTTVSPHDANADKNETRMGNDHDRAVGDNAPSNDAYMLPAMDAHRRIRTHRRTHAQTHARTDARARTHTHTQTHAPNSPTPQ
jgi:hypothetical protein